jgi:hypothetical protein
VGKGIALADRERLAITLAVWLAAVVLAELTPLRELSPNEPVDADGSR